MAHQVFRLPALAAAQRRRSSSVKEDQTFWEQTLARRRIPDNEEASHVLRSLRHQAFRSGEILSSLRQGAGCHAVDAHRQPDRRARPASGHSLAGSIGVSSDSRPYFAVPLRARYVVPVADSAWLRARDPDRSRLGVTCRQHPRIGYRLGPASAGALGTHLGHRDGVLEYGPHALRHDSRHLHVVGPPARRLGTGVPQRRPRGVAPIGTGCRPTFFTASATVINNVYTVSRPGCSCHVSSPAQFLLVGAPKAGTTSLYHYLRQHPQIYMSPIKEPNYFASEISIENVCEGMRDHARRDVEALHEYLSGPMSELRFGGMISEWADYLKLFQRARGARAVGEASVCYLWSRTAAANIFAKAPEARIIAVLRNPADREFSEYWHSVNAGVTRITFRQAIETSLHRKSDQFAVFYPFLEFGLYYEQVRRYLDVFGRDRVRIYLFENEYRKRLQQMLAEIFGFLGLDRGFTPDMSERRLESQVPQSLALNYLLKRHGLWERLKSLCPEFLRPPLKALVFKRRGSPTIDAGDREYLVAYYREDIGKLAKLLGRDLSCWLR